MIPDISTDIDSELDRIGVQWSDIVVIICILNFLLQVDIKQSNGGHKTSYTT